MDLRLETERLILQPFQITDAKTLADYRSHPQVAQYQIWDIPFSETTARQLIQEVLDLELGKPGEWYQIAIKLKSNLQIIGDCAFCILLEDAKQAEIGFTLTPQSQGHGYATEAGLKLLEYLFTELHLHRIRAICHTDNQPSIKLLERLGMRREAHFVQNIWFKGEWVSEYWYALLQSEWRKNLKVYLTTDAN